MSTQISIGILGDYLRKFLKLPMTIFEPKSIGDDQQRLSAHSRLQSFMTGSTVFFVVCAFLYGNRHLLQFIGVGRISWLNHSEHFNIRAEVDISSMKDFRGNTLCSAYLVIREIPMLELVIQKVL